MDIFTIKWWLNMSLEDVRNLVLILAAVIGLPLAIWRSMLLQKQTNLSEKGLNLDRYSKNAAMLSDEMLSGRLAGIIGLEALAMQDPKQYARSVSELLSVFIRDRSVALRSVFPTQKELDEQLKRGAEPKGMRPEQAPADIQTAVVALSNISLLGTVFPCNLRGAYLFGARLENVNLPDANLELADMRYSNLNGANLGLSNLSNVDMTGATLDDASLPKTILFHAVLRGASLQSVDLTEAKLIRADLEDAYLVGAFLSHAKLTGANLNGANFNGAKELGTALFNTAKIENVSWPNDFTPKRISREKAKSEE